MKRDVIRVEVLGSNIAAIRELMALYNIPTPTPAVNMALSQILPELLNRARAVQQGFSPAQPQPPAPVASPVFTGTPTMPAPAVQSVPNTARVSQRDALKQAMQQSQRVEP